MAPLILFWPKNTFEPNVLKWVIKKDFMSSSLFACLIINVNIFSNFQKEWCTSSRKKDVWKKNKDYSLLRFECFEHARIFFICVKFWTCKSCNEWKVIPKTSWQSKLLCFRTCVFSNIQDYSFKECPLIWVVSLIMTLPIRF